MNLAQILLLIYVTGVFLSAILTFLLSKDPCLKIRILAALLIGLTWPLSIPVVLVSALV
ncbi:GhoT/OrtT family toxin [Citrobacter koseri]|uniref:GhoT/OrtT family toxin n=1 Tax=Citrobacter koseri TaxID=545 RepID=UPI001E5EB021|nr:GhoT/OrtT family toxin [Citrobacter koseri]